MNNSADRSSKRAAIAADELIRLEKQTLKARLLLARLQEGLVEAGKKIGGEASLLIETNQQLVVAAIDAQVQAETTARSAELDVLTALPNRIVLLDRFTQAIEVAKRYGSCLALLFLDINNFKHINDSLGHNVGDKVLQHVADLLTAVIRKADTVSRHGGDEFLILLDEISQRSDATLIADKIHAALIAPYQINGHVLSLTASIGISFYPDHGEDTGLLIERADLAMYHAKRNSLGSCVYADDELDNDASSEGVVAAPRKPVHDAAGRHAHLREANERLIIAALTAQDRQADAEQARHQQSTFLAVLAHELRNPLGPIRMAATLLDHVGDDPPQLQELQRVINRQVTRMARLLDDLFDVARVNSGKLTINSAALDLNALIHEVIDTYTLLIHQRQQHLIVQTPDTEVFFNGDSGRLTQIFSNLLDNASKYTPEGGELKLVLSIENDTALVIVSDSGIGILPAALPYIFEPFVQDAAATGYNDEGLGIGLTVVRELVAAHNGIVTAHSGGSGLGSQFIVSLPLSITSPSSRVGNLPR